MLGILSKRSFAASVFIILSIITLIVSVLHLVLQYINLEVFYQQNGFVYELSNRFDLDDESSVPTWLSQFYFLLIAAGGGLAAYLSDKKSVRRAWLLIAGLGLVFSIDEIATLHEFILQSIHNVFFRDAAPTSIDNAWLLVTPLILAAFAWSIWKISKLFPKRTILLFSGAVAMLLIGAVFVDMLASVADRETFANQGILIAIEETLELMANVTVIYAITDYLEVKYAARLKSALKHLR